MAYTLDKAKILVVDDMKPMLSLAASVLKMLGFKHIFTAANGEEGFQAVCKNDPDLVITDWMMPVMDGLELTKMIRRNPLAPNPYVPVMMMTGFSSRLRVENARDAGITEFLVKPFTSRDLYARIVQIIERPRQFVEASEFFGPDRRRKLVRDYQGPRRRGEDTGGEKSPPGTEQERIQTILNKLKEDAKNL